MGDRGRLVIPQELRERRGWGVGVQLILIDTPEGVVVTNREHLKRLVRSQLAGSSLVHDLVAERRRWAAAEDA